MTKFPRRFDQFLQIYEPNCGNICSVWQCWRILQKFLDPDPIADDFQHSITSLSKDTCLIKKIHEDAISGFSTRFLTEKQTDRQDRQTPGKTLTSVAKVMSCTKHCKLLQHSCMSTVQRETIKSLGTMVVVFAFSRPFVCADYTLQLTTTAAP